MQRLSLAGPPIALVPGYHDDGHYFAACALRDELHRRGRAAGIFQIWRGQSKTLDGLFSIFRAAASSGISCFPDYLGHPSLRAALQRELALPPALLRSPSIVSFHPWSSSVIAEQLGRRRSVLIDVHTDFTPFPVFPHPRIDWYCGVFPRLDVDFRTHRRQVVTGIPVRTSFRPGPKHDRAVILTGADGWGDAVSTLRLARRICAGYALVVLCGRNEALRRRLARFRGVQALGFVDDPSLYLNSASFVFTKASGLSIAEAIAAGALPVYAGSRVPWERQAALELAGRGIGLYAESGSLPLPFERAAEDRVLQEKLRAQMARAAPTGAAARLAELVLHPPSRVPARCAPRELDLSVPRTARYRRTAAYVNHAFREWLT